MTERIAQALERLEDATATIHAGILSGAALDEAFSERQEALEALDSCQPFWKALPHDVASAYLARLERISIDGAVVMAELGNRKRVLVEELSRHAELRRMLSDTTPPAVIDRFG